ncbi:hypothetical protein NC99_30400 [Sunxiuqinia dokdonensis]|uniref:Uncharacterized protein n=1 Tax=Sunxiuqinia dokdonensis TaxID=1409788 RepID=A0A0L8V759_9BACT|nr:hypothetical protein NC99_30400 [Sunxiuqinia dokdonensis]
MRLVDLVWVYFDGGFDLFQFQYGAIGGCGGCKIISAGKIFQFQYGAIGGLIRPMSRSNPCLFQFQYGAIGGC